MHQSSPWVAGAKDTSLMDVTWDPLMRAYWRTPPQWLCFFWRYNQQKHWDFCWRIYWQRWEILPECGALQCHLEFHDISWLLVIRVDSKPWFGSVMVLKMVGYFGCPNDFCCVTATNSQMFWSSFLPSRDQFLFTYLFSLLFSGRNRSDFAEMVFMSQQWLSAWFIDRWSETLLDDSISHQPASSWDGLRQHTFPDVCKKPRPCGNTMPLACWDCWYLGTT